MQQERRLPRGGGYRCVRAAGAKTAEFYLYGPIGASWFEDGITADRFRKDLAAARDATQIAVRINSDGGDVFDAQAIYSLLTQHKADITVHIDGLAASAASFIAMAGDQIEIAESAWMMIHNASGGTYGTAADMRKTADLLDSVCASMAKLYSDRTKCPVNKIQKMMDDETWMNGAQAVEAGFADVLMPNMAAIAASISQPDRFKRLPAALRPNRARAMAALTRMKAAAPIPA